MKAPVTCLILLMVGRSRGGNSNDFECSETGNFDDPNDSSCKRYYSCRVGNGGHWIETSYECPDKTIFDKKTGHCSSTAKCYSDSSDLSDSSDSSDYDGDDFVCKRPGLFDDGKDATCSKYYECKQNHHGVLFAVNYPCPPPSRFDPKLKHCSKHYVCPRHFKCSRVGRFEDATDDNNKRYFLCVKKTNGDFVQGVYSCPLYSRFDPIDDICVIPDESISDEENIHDHDLPTENWDHLDSFKCEARGYFANKLDNNCKSYYFCDVNADGKLAKYVLACPRNYGWNRDTNLCTYGYSC